MNRSIKIASLLLVIGWAAGARAESVLQGDPARGRALYRLHCGACHGSDGHGDGPLAHNFGALPPVALNDPALLMRRGDAYLQRAIAAGRASMPAFGPRFAELDAWDIIAHLHHGQPEVADFFPDAARFTVRTYVFDADSLKRLAPLLGKLTGDDAKVIVVAAFGGKKVAEGPSFVPQDPRLLVSLEPKRKLGYLSIEPVSLPGFAHPVLLSLAFDREGFISVVRPEPGQLGVKEFARLEKLFSGYVGQGGKAYDYAELKPPKLPAGDKDAKTASEVAKVLTRAYYRALEGAVMFDKEERERHWAD